MQFNTIDFLIFFPIIVAIFFIIPSRLRTTWLLVASYYFYMSWNAKYAILIGTSTLITYISALLIAGSAKDNKTRRKLYLAGCIIINLGILAVFKYANFFVDSIDTVLSNLHLSTINRRFDLLLPVGISFYTFQAIGYVIDVYRGEVTAEKNFIKYALFVSFFPQLVAGPIERSKNLLSRIRTIGDAKLWDIRRITSGAILMVWGLFMKMVIADRVAILVNTVFDDYMTYGSTELVAAAIGFALQIYCDFGSYSLVAIGAAKIMGFDLMENFASPYFAKSIADFWSRWHISLTTWFRDYLYIPLGGNRKGKIRKYINIMIVFTVSGLWHGADWSYVLWGGIHGLYRVIGETTTKIRTLAVQKAGIKTDCFSFRLLKTTVTFVLVTFAWIFFRAPSVTDALRYIRRMFTAYNPWVLFDEGIYSIGLSRQEMNILVISVVMLVIVDYMRYKKGLLIDALLFAQNTWFEWTVIIVLIVMIFVFGQYGPAFDPQQFIYFQF